MKKIVLLSVFILTACGISALPFQGKDQGGTHNSSAGEEKDLPIVPDNWFYARCPDQEPVKGCELEFPIPIDNGFELQSSDAALMIKSGTLLFVQTIGSYPRQFSASELEKCKEYKIMSGDCDRRLRLNLKKEGFNIIGFENAVDTNVNKFTYYIFTPTQSYFLRTEVENGDPTLLDTSILNVRLATGSTLLQKSATK